MLCQRNQTKPKLIVHDMIVDDDDDDDDVALKCEYIQCTFNF